MSPEDRPLTIIISTFPEAPYHHLTQLVMSNPTADIRFAVSQAPKNKATWKNCDRTIHKWWRTHGHTVDPNSRVVILEQDVLVTRKLPALYPNGLMGAEVKKTSGWYWWGCDVPKLPAELQAVACGLVPFAVIFTRPQVLDVIFGPYYDSIYQLDLICELRVATLAKHAGFTVEATHLPGVKWHVTEPDLNDPAVANWGIYHSVKSPLNN